MTTAELRTADPTLLSPPLRALREDAAGNWDAAHEAVQDDPSPEAAWVHAYLHRKEGDTSNAAYWYERAGRRRPAVGGDAEWEEIAAALLRREP